MAEAAAVHAIVALVSRAWPPATELELNIHARHPLDNFSHEPGRTWFIPSGSITTRIGHEVEGALEEEQKNSRLILFPIRLNDIVMNTLDDWAEKIKRRRHIGDFSNWKDKISYQKALERLLRDLKTTGGESNVERV